MADEQETTAALSSPPSARELLACWDQHMARFDLTKASLTIGRGDACDVQIPHASVSRIHARLALDGVGMLLEDLGSANGARVDGTPVLGRAAVALGAIVELGAVRLVVRVKPSARADAMGEVRRLVSKVAESPMSLILVGETGVGKEVLAEQVHVASRRAGPLVRINCAGLAPSLLESELFGYERGAFTGATQAKPGLIESADGGTLFLDELGEMPEATQTKLLRVLESREVRRIGALRAKPVDVRFVSATHRDLRTLAALGRFREDLLFRLNGLTIRIPPLRERREEIPSLAEAFLKAASARGGRPAPRLSDGVRALLESYRWPGNVRELKNVIERVALLCDAPEVLAGHLSFDPPLMPSAPSPTAPPPEIEGAPVGLEGSESGERERIQRELAKVGGNQAAAAKALGMTARVLAYRMDKLGLPRPRRK